jgi:hypothetical protein
LEIISRATTRAVLPLLLIVKNDPSCSSTSKRDVDAEAFHLLYPAILVSSSQVVCPRPERCRPEDWAEHFVALEKDAVKFLHYVSGSFL